MLVSTAFLASFAIFPLPKYFDRSFPVLYFLDFQYVGYIVKIQNDVGFHLLSILSNPLEELMNFLQTIFKSAIKIKENLPNQESAQSALSGQHVPGENLPSERTRWFPGPRHTPGLLLSYFHWTFGFDFAPSRNLSLMKKMQENVKQRLLTGITSAIFFIYVLGFKFKVELKYL